jgi:ferrochelatase
MAELGVVTLHFGEPEEPTEAAVVPFLERIFTVNASLEGDSTPERVRERASELARRRAPGLIEEYRVIGGSPLNRQARAHAAALEAELRRRGHDARVAVGLQFTDPSIRTAAGTLRAAGVERLVALPVYPLCGPSTTVAALAELARQVEALDWDVPVLEISGWHRHPSYIALRADTVRRVVSAAGLDLNAPDTRLVFSAHGTPIRYLREGSRYDLYVDDVCRAIAREVGATAYALGFQNHTNRPIEWTQPDIEAVIEGIDARTVVVEAVSFMHEQSETLAELDHELREAAEARGLAFHRVPVPHDDGRFAGVLADLVEARAGLADAVPTGLHRCRCRPDARTRCTNAPLQRPA